LLLLTALIWHYKVLPPLLLQLILQLPLLLMLPLWHVALHPAVGSGSSSSHLSRCMTSA
jgi:hypothetical protein